MNIFYVYRHIRKDTGEVFYVGKGRGKRAWSKSDRNQYWKNIVWSGLYQQDCAEYLGVFQSNVNKCLKRLRKSTGSYTFKYFEEVC